MPNNSKFGAIALAAMVKEVLTNERIKVQSIVNVMAPIWQVQKLAVFESALSAEVLEKLFLSSADSLVEAWREAN